MSNPKESNNKTKEPASEHPFPLKRIFRRRFVPAFLGFIGIFLVLIGFTAKHVTESIYLELAQRRAQTIARAVETHAPKSWNQLMAGLNLDDLQPNEAKALAKAFSDEARELNLSELKIYDLSRKVLFATHTDEIGTMEDGSALRNVIEHSDSEVVTKTLKDGTQQYELYVPIFKNNGKLRAVFELYEPVGYLNAILINAAIPTLAIPGGLLFFLVLTLSSLVNRAQTNIDERTHALNELRRRIETFVSTSAVKAAKNIDQSGSIQSRKMTTTLMFSDIRSFTSFVEESLPEEVVGFLNQLMALQVTIVTKHGGDVDKMIGDAVFARFDGVDGGARAIAAAREIFEAVKLGEFPRKLGIGVYQGEVISGSIGPESRRDYTVIGDAVNISARLCSEALAGQIVVDAALADESFGPSETIQVKGRQNTVTIRRLTI